MKNDKNKIQEPYKPENTPNPPQIIDPSVKKERNENDEPIGDKQKGSKNGESTKKQQPAEKK
jgi:hypothetical protein